MTGSPRLPQSPISRAAGSPASFSQDATPWLIGPAQEAEFAEILRKLWRRKSLVIASILGAMILAVGIGALLGPRYTATTQIRVGIPEPKVSNVEAVVSGSSVDAAAVLSETYVLRSRSLIGHVVDRLALDEVPEFNPYLRPPSLWDWADPRALFRRLVRFLSPAEMSKGGTDAETGQIAEDSEREAVIDTVQSMIDVYPLDRSRVLAVGAESENPALAARIANTLGRSYIEDQVINKVQMTERANKWLHDHIRRLRAQLEKDERAVEDYRRKYGLYRSHADTITVQQLAELNTQLILAQATRAEADARLKQATDAVQSKKSADSLPEVLNSPLIQALKQQEATVARRVAELSSHYGRKHPRMRNALAELNDTKGKIRVEVGKVIDGLRNAALTAGARYEALRENFEKAKNVAGEDNQETIALRALEREAEASRTLFQQFLQRSKETSAQMDIQQADAQIVSRAAVPVSPSFPPTNLLFAVALIGGTLIGVLLALIAEQLDGTFRTDEEVETSTGLPTLTVVPRVGRWQSGRELVLKKPAAPYSEALRRLDAILRLSDEESEPRTLMVASAVPNEGKSDICLSLARMAAASGANVIMVDCDWRRPQLHSILRRSNEMGLGDLLTGQGLPDDVVYRDSSGAHLIFAGKIKPRQTHLLFSDRMRYLLESLQKHYDLVLIDTPPVLVGAEILHLSRLVDKAIYVVRWGHTPRHLALKALRQLAAAGAPVAGTVLSQVDTKSYRRYARSGQDYGYRPAAAQKDI